MFQFWAWAANRVRQRESLRSARSGWRAAPGPILIIKVEEKLHKPGLLFLRDIWKVAWLTEMSVPSFTLPAVGASFENPSRAPPPHPRFEPRLLTSGVVRGEIRRQKGGDSRFKFRVPWRLNRERLTSPPLDVDVNLLLRRKRVPANLSNDRFTPARDSTQREAYAR